MKPYCEKYLAHVKATASLNTYGAYERDLRSFWEYFSSKNVGRPQDVTEEDIGEYFASLSENVAPSSFNRRLSAIRGFYKYLISTGEADVNPAAGVDFSKSPDVKKLPGILTRSQVEALIEQPDPQSPKGRRDRAMLELCYATGLRVSELVDLRLSDLRLSTGLIICESGKRSRAITLYPMAVKRLEEYLEYSRPVLVKGAPESPWLFVNLKGDRLTRQGFWKLIKHYAESAGIDPAVISPHSLRHSFAVHLLENGANVRDVQSVMGNADVSTMKDYVRLLRSSSNDAAMARHPRAGKLKV